MQPAVHESRRGDFTAYCGGQVTEACIDRALHGNSLLRKRQASFARAARHVAARHRRS